MITQVISNAPLSSCFGGEALNDNFKDQSTNKLT
jgi:hypothetical protein